MKNTLNNSRKTSFLLILFTITLLFSGCGKKDPALEAYKTNMNQFFENIKIFDSSINAINPESETATQDLLSLLDSMNTSFSQMASLTVPDDFPGVADLATEATEYMAEAVSYYHQAYEGDTYDANLADVARQNYERANVRLQYIVSILHGNIPEEIFTYDDDSSSTQDDNAYTNDISDEDYNTDDTVFYDDSSSDDTEIPEE